MNDMHSEIEEYLGALARDTCYSVDEVLKTSAYETTEKVYFVGENGSKQGPMIRKRFTATVPDGQSMGKAYERIWQAQREGRRFLHIPRIYECYSTENNFTVIMEYVSGETLAELIFRQDPSADLAADVFPQICDAVMELHEYFETPIIHRDLKPSNVMITKSGAVTIIDFGIARSFCEGGEADTNHFGTRSYAPPEQFGFGQTSVRSDVYALGMLLYYCLVECNPSPSMAGAGFSDVPAAFRPVLAKATAFDPQQRYASVRELRDAFYGVCEAARGLSTQNVSRETFQQPSTPSSPDFLPQQDVSRETFLQSSLGLLRRFHIPLCLGIIWNVFILAVWALFMVAGVAAVVNPEPQSQDTPFITILLIDIGALWISGSAIAFALMDKRPFRKIAAKRFPKFAEASRGQIFAICVAVFLGGAIFTIVSAVVSAAILSF